jgi:hypothetical protein
VLQPLSVTADDNKSSSTLSAAPSIKAYACRDCGRYQDYAGHTIVGEPWVFSRGEAVGRGIAARHHHPDTRIFRLSVLKNLVQVRSTVRPHLMLPQLSQVRGCVDSDSRNQETLAQKNPAVNIALRGPPSSTLKRSARMARRELSRLDSLVMYDYFPKILFALTRHDRHGAEQET